MAATQPSVTSSASASARAASPAPAASRGSRNPGASRNSRYGVITVIGLCELALLFALPLLASLVRVWQMGLVAVIVLAVLVAAASIWSAVLLIRSEEWILHAPGIFLLCGSGAGLAVSLVQLVRFLTAAKKIGRIWMAFATRVPAARAAFLDRGSKSLVSSWFWFSAIALAVMLIAGFLFEMLRRDRSTLILSLGACLLFGAAGWCGSGWLFLPILLMSRSLHFVLLAFVILFVFAIALLTGVRFACEGRESLPAAYGTTCVRSTGLVLATASLALLGVMIPILLTI